MSQLSQPVVWTIILNWNGADETIACLHSVRTLTYPTDVLIVDNGSSDDSPAKITTQFPEVHLVEMGANVGYSRGVNAGIKVALAHGADYVFLLNNDARVAPDMLGHLVDYAEYHATCGLCSPLIYELDQPDHFWVVGGLWRVYNIIHEGWHTLDKGQYTKPTPFDVLFGTALLIRRCVIEEIGFFDERFFVYYEDVDFGLRARRAGYSAVLVPNARMWHIGSYSTRNNAFLREFYLARGRVLLFRKYLPGMHFLVFLLTQIWSDVRTVGHLIRRGKWLNAMAYWYGFLSGVVELSMGNG